MNKIKQGILMYVMLFSMAPFALAEEYTMNADVIKGITADIVSAIGETQPCDTNKDSDDNPLIEKERLKEIARQHGMSEEYADFFAKKFQSKIETGCAFAKQPKDVGSFIAAVVKETSKDMAKGKDNPLKKELAKVYTKLETLEELASRQKKKKIILPKEVKQLEYMILGKQLEDICNSDKKEAYIKELCSHSHPTLQERLEYLGDILFTQDEVRQNFREQEDMVQKVNMLRLRLNHENWERDMYWFGGSVMAMPGINAVITGISMHVYPWYARSIQANLSDVDDGWRRISTYFDVVAVSGGATQGGRKYSGPSYGLGLGFDIRPGFIIKGGAEYLKYTFTTGGVTKSAYVFQPSFGVSITREFFQDLIGE